MSDLKNMKLFFVDFGKAGFTGGYITVGYAQMNVLPVYIIAKDYNEASNKAEVHLSEQLSKIEKQSVVTPDGSLNNFVVNGSIEDLPVVKTIQLISDKLIY